MGDMDSANSASMQSSSTGGGGGGGGGDDQEYQSRGESISAFFNATYQTGGFDSNAPPLQLYSHLHNSSSVSVMFDHQHNHHHHQLSNLFDLPLSQSSLVQTPNFMVSSNSTINNNNNNNKNNNNSNNNIDTVWPNKFGSIGGSRSSDDVNCTTGPAAGYRINDQHQPNSMGTAQGAAAKMATPRTLALQSAENSNSNSSPRASSYDHNNQNNPNLTGPGPGPGSGRNPKKRSRASRRAPTTVLTTDTNNFRQMVQEFTGIPAPPFTAAASSTRTTRRDLFAGMGMGMGMGMGLGMGMGMGMGIHPRSSAPPYLLRPFPQKILPHTTTTASSSTALRDNLISSSTSTSSPTTSSTTNIISSTSTSPNAASFLSIPPPTPPLPPPLLPPNPVITFQSLLQPSASDDKFPLIQQDSSSNLGCKATTSMMNDFGLGPTTTASWAALHQGLGLSQGNNHAANYNNIPTTISCSVSDAGGTSSDNVNNLGGAVRGEGMVDSWICSSD